jgi:hypothetical protein
LTEKTRSWFVILVFAVLGVVGYNVFLKPFLKEEPEVDRVLQARSTWSVTMQAYEPQGPISAETYRISNDNGAVKMFYSASNRDGTITKQFNVPLAGPNGTFLFEQLRLDGVWELDNKPVRPNSKEQYIIALEQTIGDQGGARAFGFTDPHYWATTKAQEYQLRLPAKSMHGLNLTHIGSAGRPLRDSRYLKIVNEIRSFGPQSVLDAEALIRSELAAAPTQQSVERALRRKKSGT